VLIYDNVTGTRGRMDVNMFTCTLGCGDNVDVRALFSYGGQSQSATAWSIENLGPDVNPVEFRTAEGVKVTSLSTSVPLVGPGERPLAVFACRRAMVAALDGGSLTQRRPNSRSTAPRAR
jgi:hypothetical protein